MGYSDCILLHYVRTISVQTMFYVGAWKEAHQRLRRTKIELVNEEEKNRPRTTEMFIFYSKFTLSFAFAHHFAFTFQPYTHKLHSTRHSHIVVVVFLSLEWIESKMTQSWVLFFWRIVQSSSQSVKCFIPIRLDRQWQQQRQLKTGTINLHNKVGLGMQTLTLKQYFTPKYRNLCK